MTQPAAVTCCPVKLLRVFPTVAEIDALLDAAHDIYNLAESRVAAGEAWTMALMRGRRLDALSEVERAALKKAEGILELDRRIFQAAKRAIPELDYELFFAQGKE